MIVTVERRADPVSVERILRALPDWFGIEEAIVSYVEQAARLDSYLALVDDEVVGAALVTRHFAASAELTLIAVELARRGAGIGRALIQEVERHLRADGCRFLEVHTVGPSYEHEGYAATRAFYESIGFTAMHEFEGLDWDGPTLVYVKAL